MRETTPRQHLGGTHSEKCKKTKTKCKIFQMLPVIKLSALLTHTHKEVGDTAVSAYDDDDDVDDGRLFVVTKLNKSTLV